MDNLNNRILSNNLSFYMQQKGIDRSQLCKDLGFKYSTVSEWLSGKKYPRMDKIELLAAYFEINKSDLIELVGPLRSINTEMKSDLEEHMHDMVELGSNIAKEMIDSNYASNPSYILYYYNRLNSVGRAEATRRVAEMAKLDEYKKTDDEK